MVGTFADRIDAWLLGEGVERGGELDALVRLGVPLVQGYYLARPGPPWPGLNPEAVLSLHDRQRPTTFRTVRDVVEPVPTARAVEEAAAHFARNATHSVVLVDAESHPVAIFTPDLAHVGVGERGMRVNLDTPISQALRRALTREPAHRYEPLLCTDTAGRFLGVARIERMIEAALVDDGPHQHRLAS